MLIPKARIEYRPGPHILAEKPWKATFGLSTKRFATLAEACDRMSEAVYRQRERENRERRTGRLRFA